MFGPFSFSIAHFELFGRSSLSPELVSFAICISIPSIWNLLVFDPSFWTPFSRFLGLGCPQIQSRRGMRSLPSWPLFDFFFWLARPTKQWRLLHDSIFTRRRAELLPFPPQARLLYFLTDPLTVFRRGLCLYCGDHIFITRIFFFCGVGSSPSFLHLRLQSPQVEDFTFG